MSRTSSLYKMKTNSFNTRQNKAGMTLMEILIVVSLIALLGGAIYNSLANGIRVWERNHEVVIEEDIAILFEKINRDIRNTFPFTKIWFEGNAYSVSFATIVRTKADSEVSSDENEYINQIGRVEYYFDSNKKGIFKKQSNYSQAIKEEYGQEQKLVSPVDEFNIRYFYMADNEEVVSTEVLESFPTGLEIEVKFSDKYGQKVLKKVFNIPIGS